MSRTGVEEKPPWRAVPPAVRRGVEATLGSAIVRGARVYGGYGPTPTFRLLLADGRRAFFKGVNAASNEFMRGAIVREERVYRDATELIGPWAPECYGGFQCDDWRVLLLQDVGPKSAPPWARTLTRKVAHAYADFHAHTLGRALPDWLPGPQAQIPRGWPQRVVAESDGFRAVAELAVGHEREALDWLRMAIPRLIQLAETAPNLPGPYALLHGDTRSDNLRFRDGRLYLFDWPSTEIGRSEFDLVGFAQSVTVDGGVAPEQVVAWYEERLPLRADAMDAAVAWLTLFFADLAWRPPIPGLPRLRSFQRQQLTVMLMWAARRLRMPEPAWATAISQNMIR